MDHPTRKALTEALSELTTALAEDLRAQILEHELIRTAAQHLHQEESVGEDFTVWTDLLSRRAAVMWVLRSVYVRVLEDRGLLQTRRIVDSDSQQLFRTLAPDLGETSFFRWIYRDLRKPEAGLAELFSPTPAEVAQPSDKLSRRLLEFWRETDPDTGELRWRFDDEDFDSRLLGDLYQDLDPVVKDRYALLQTPDFVVDFILDETLTPAIEAWGVDEVRLIDPACGSGHFLLAAYDRLVAGMHEAYGDQMTDDEIAHHVLERVVGIDINDYACNLARARLLMAALEASGSDDLSQAADLHPQIFWADGLVKVEDAPEEHYVKQELPQFGMEPTVQEDKIVAMLTRSEVRDRLKPLLKEGFHAVVANPPYITEKDKAKRDYYRDQYEAAYSRYSLVAPFVERCFQLAVRSGHVGLIVANSFMKRGFGKALVQRVLPKLHLNKVVDTSGAYLPGHGTPTLILFGRNQESPDDATVNAVLGKRGEPSVPDDPATGLVWRSIEAHHNEIGYENEFISVDRLPAQSFSQHPWSLQGGGASKLKVRLDSRSLLTLDAIVTSIGFACISAADAVFIREQQEWNRTSAASLWQRVIISGEDVRNWTSQSADRIFFPYDGEFSLASVSTLNHTLRVLWRYRRKLEDRPDFSGGTYREVNRPWYEFHQFPTDRMRVPLSITFAEVATHNHYVLDRGGKVFKQTAPVIKLAPEASVDDHLALVGLLNSSTGDFWMDQVFYHKGIGDEEWTDRLQRDSTKTALFPLPVTRHSVLESFARELDRLGAERTADTARSALDSAVGAEAPTAAGVRDALEARRGRDLERLYLMVGLQDELDWFCYQLYGIEGEMEQARGATSVDVLSPIIIDPSDVPPLRPGLRPFEIALALQDDEIREAIKRGEETTRSPTEWFKRHGWEPETELGAVEEFVREQTDDEALAARYTGLAAERLARMADSKEIGLVEQPTYKRRWYNPDFEDEESEALDGWLADRLEDWAKGQDEPWKVRHAAVALMDEPAVRAVAELMAGRPDYDLEKVLAGLVRQDSVPNNKHHVFKPKGLERRAAWERTWELQHAEDRGEDVDPPVPPKYRKSNFRKGTYWSLRGKLDVPKERFIAFTEMPGAEGDDTYYGWAGWDPLQRARVLLELDEKADQNGVPLEDRYGLLYGAQFLLPYVAWDNEQAASEFKAIIDMRVGLGGVSEDMLGQWAERVPAP